MINLLFCLIIYIHTNFYKSVASFLNEIKNKIKYVNERSLRKGKFFSWKISIKIAALT